MNATALASTPHTHADIDMDAWRNAVSASAETRQTVLDWARIQFPNRDAADIEYDMFCGLRIALEHGINWERTMRYSVISGVATATPFSLDAFSLS